MDLQAVLTLNMNALLPIAAQMLGNSGGTAIASGENAPAFQTRFGDQLACSVKRLTGDVLKRFV
jgi:hypothetical protein